MELDKIGIYSEGREISTIIFNSEPHPSKFLDALGAYRKVFVVVDALAMERSQHIVDIVQVLDSEGFPHHG